jgi:hypothetical protein
MPQKSKRSCENIDFGFFRPRVFSYLQEKKSGFFNIFTASKRCLRHPAVSGLLTVGLWSWGRAHGQDWSPAIKIGGP